MAGSVNLFMFFMFGETRRKNLEEFYVWVGDFYQCDWIIDSIQHSSFGVEFDKGRSFHPIKSQLNNALDKRCHYETWHLLKNNKLESPLWFTFWFSLIFKELWLVNVFFWLIHQSLISWFYYLIEYSGVWSVINHVATYQYWETLGISYPNC